MQNNSTQYTTSSMSSAPVVERVLLPTQVVQKPVAVHEEIRKELVEEIQPVINVEKYQTQVHQVTQPLFDREVRAVSIESRTLPTEVLPQVNVAGRGMAQNSDISTTTYRDTATVVVEKPALFTEVERLQIVEEIQPVIYKETVIPQLIQETKPVYQKIVEGPVYSQQTLPSHSVANPSQINPAYVTDSTVIAPSMAREMLPTQIVEKPLAIHEEIRKEVIEEIQPVVNVEKLKTEVHQVTQPLYDREVRAVDIQQRTLNTEILPEVLIEGRGSRAVMDQSTVQYQQGQTVVIEKPARVIEIERTQIIEEIQPVLYKETVVPHVIKETKPVYQKIVEGPVYSQQTLPAQQLRDTNYQMPVQQQMPIQQQMPVQQQMPIQQQMPLQQPVMIERVVVAEPVFAPQPQLVAIPINDTSRGMSNIPVQTAPLPQEHGLHKKVITEDTVTTTTTTTVASTGVGMNSGANTGANTGAHNAQGNDGQKKHGLSGLFHHGNKGANTSNNTTGTGVNQSGLGPYGTTAAPLSTVNAPLGQTVTNSSHTERTLAQGAKVVEDTVTSTTHSQTVTPARRI